MIWVLIFTLLGGRNVIFNSSRESDHGNNQNFFTFDGAGISVRALGKLAGRTQRIGTPFQNRQFTAPDGSRKAEQAATVNGFVELILWGC